MRASLRVVVTLLVVAAAVLAGIWLWRYYMLSPWTRDARVRADVVVVAPDVSGWVTDLEVKDNQVVKVGDVLMRIDQERYQANLEQARAVAETRHQQYLLRQNEAARRSRLGIGAISAEDKENAQINAAIARSEYQEALAQVKIAELNLKRSELRAARNGQVTNLRLAQGNYATAGRRRWSRRSSATCASRACARRISTTKSSPPARPEPERAKELPMNDRFRDKVALVSGAAQGIGLGVARRLLEEGARVVAVDRSELVHELAGDACLCLTADLERYAECQRALERTLERFGRLDILVNNVGGTLWAKPYQHYAEDEIEAELRRSLLPTLWCCRAALPAMLGQGSGAIVNVSSVATRGVNRVPYGAAKGGVNALTACLAFETADQGIRVNAVAPGGTDAPPRRIPRNAAAQSEEERRWYRQIVEQTLDSSLMKRYGSIDEQVAAILFLASDEASYITGVTLPVAGGDLG